MTLIISLVLFALLLIVVLIVVSRVFFNSKKYILTKASEYEYSAKYKSAIKEYKKLINQGYSQVGDINIWQKLGSLYEINGDLYEAREYYQKLIGYHAENIGLFDLDVLKKCADLSVSLKDNENVLRYSSRILLLDKKNKYAIRNIGLTLLKESMFKDALSYLERIAHSKHFKKDVELLNATYLCYHNDKRYTLAIEYLKKVLDAIDSSSPKYIDTEIMLIHEYILAGMYQQALDFILLFKSNKTDNKNFLKFLRMHLFILHKLNLKNEIYKEFDKLKNVINTKKNSAILYLDMAVYSYFHDEIKKAMEYIESVTLESLHDINIEKMKEYLRVLNSVLAKHNKDQVSSLQKMIKNIENEYIDRELSRLWNKNLYIWQDSIINENLSDSLFEVEQTCNTKNIFLEEAENSSTTKNNDKYYHQNNKQKDKSLDIDKIYSLKHDKFEEVCKNIIQKKLKYNIIEEAKIDDNATSNKNDLNFITRSMMKFNRDKTLISFRRWNTDIIGEIALYDFVSLMNQNDAQYGILFVPVDMSQSAKSYIRRDNRITVFSKSQFNEYLADEEV